jgi:glucosyl-3-phosphoglycerate synthase
VAPIETFHHSDFPAPGLLGRRQTISAVVPTRGCQATIGPIATTLVAMRERGAIDEVVVVDAGTDRTAAVAAGAGATVVDEATLLPEFGPVRGKGDAMWRGLTACSGEIVCFVDGDSGGFGEHYVAGLTGPLLDGRADFVKAFFRRPFRTAGGEEAPEGGGRVTELTARPLLRAFWPELADVRQPLAGEVAAPRSLWSRVPFMAGYSVELGTLLAAHRRLGARIAQVDLDVRRNEHQPLSALGAMAGDVLAAATHELALEGRLAAPPTEVVVRPPLEELEGAAVAGPSAPSPARRA